MFRRRTNLQQPAWRAQVDRARRLIASRRPPAWILERMATLERLLADSEVDHDRLASSVDQLDIERARDELKSALRFADGSPAHCELIGSLRRRYETINELINRQSALRAAIDRTVVDLELLAARSVELGSRDDLWRLDESVRRLQHDVDALELAHREVEAI